MSNFNRVILMGNLTATPELRVSQAGNSWTRFGMAVNDRYRSRDGEEVDRVNFVDVTAYGGQAETLVKYLDKGSPLLVEGRLSQDKWETEEGEKRSRIGVRLGRFHFVPGGKRRDGAAA